MAKLPGITGNVLSVADSVQAKEYSPKPLLTAKRVRRAMVLSQKQDKATQGRFEVYTRWPLATKHDSRNAVARGVRDSYMNSVPFLSRWRSA